MNKWAHLDKQVVIHFKSSLKSFNYNISQVLTADGIFRKLEISATPEPGSTDKLILTAFNESQRIADLSAVFNSRSVILN